MEADTSPIDTGTPVRGDGPGPDRPDSRQPEPRRGLPRSRIAALVVGVLVICSAIALNITTGALEGLNPFRNGVFEQRTIDR
jgi:hypothetical protein